MAFVRLCRQAVGVTWTGCEGCRGGLGGGCAGVARTAWGDLAERPWALHEASPDGLSSTWGQTAPTVAWGSRSELPEGPAVEVAGRLRPGLETHTTALQPCCSLSHGGPRAGPHSPGADTDPMSPWNGVKGRDAMGHSTPRLHGVGGLYATKCGCFFENEKSRCFHKYFSLEIPV